MTYIILQGIPLDDEKNCILVNVMMQQICYMKTKENRKNTEFFRCQEQKRHGNGLSLLCLYIGVYDVLGRSEIGRNVGENEQHRQYACFYQATDRIYM